jgi:hypothetical protein
MWDVLSALIPPAVVAAVFCTAIYKLLRREMTPRTSDGRPVRDADSSSVNADGAMRTVPGETGWRAEAPRGDEDDTDKGRGPF